MKRISQTWRQKQRSSTMKKTAIDMSGHGQSIERKQFENVDNKLHLCSHTDHFQESSSVNEARPCKSKRMSEDACHEHVAANEIQPGIKTRPNVVTDGEVIYSQDRTKRNSLESLYFSGEWDEEMRIAMDAAESEKVVVTKTKMLSSSSKNKASETMQADADFVSTPINTQAPSHSISGPKLSPVLRHEESLVGDLTNGVKDRNTQAESGIRMEDEKLKLVNWNLPLTVVKKYQQAGITEMFKWQAECLLTGKALSGGNFVYSAPTSAGKTLVAEILMLKRVLETGRKAVYILPFVSVAKEKVYYLQNLFDEVGVKVEGFIGSSAPSGGFAATDIAICTIEKANSLINRLIEEQKINLLVSIVVDELHMIGDPSRGYLLELLLTKVTYLTTKASHKEDEMISSKTQVIGMSATLPNLPMLAKWLQADLYVTDFRPVPLTEMVKVGRRLLDMQQNQVGEVKSMDMVSGDEDHLMPLCVETISAGTSVLIFCPTKNWCEKLAETMARLISNCKNRCATVLFIQSPSFSANALYDADACAEVVEQLRATPVGVDPILRKVVPKGVAFHHAGLTHDEREIIEGGFRSGAIKILIATSTLSSGVNLPARRVIIRTPVFHRTLLDPLVYKQMAGRAGRKGKDTQGESILICKEKEKQKGLSLLTSHLKPVYSCLIGDHGEKASVSMKRALLEIIGGKIAETLKDIQRYYQCTYLNTCIEYKTGCNPEEEVSKTLQFLEENEFIKQRKGITQETSDKSESIYYATQLGTATLSSSLSPDEALAVLVDLRQARKCFVLENELHIIYQVTPIYLQAQWPDLDWYNYFQIWQRLPTPLKRVGELVGIKEGYLAQGIRGRRAPKTEEQRRCIAVHRRFYAALVLQDLVNETPILTVSEKYSVNKGLVQALQGAASTFAGMVTVFCQKLGWSNLELILHQFQSRLSFGISRELCDLVRISLLNGARARLLYNAGFHTVNAIALASAADIGALLINAAPFETGKRCRGESERELFQRRRARSIWVTGREGVTEMEAGALIVAEAQRIVQKDVRAMGLDIAGPLAGYITAPKNAIKAPSQQVAESKVMPHARNGDEEGAGLQMDGDRAIRAARRLSGGEEHALGVSEDVASCKRRKISVEVNSSETRFIATPEKVSSNQFGNRVRRMTDAEEGKCRREGAKSTHQQAPKTEATLKSLGGESPILGLQDGMASKGGRMMSLGTDSFLKRPLVSPCDVLRGYAPLGNKSGTIADGGESVSESGVAIRRRSGATACEKGVLAVNAEAFVGKGIDDVKRSTMRNYGTSREGESKQVDPKGMPGVSEDLGRANVVWKGDVNKVNTDNSSRHQNKMATKTEIQESEAKTKTGSVNKDMRTSSGKSRSQAHGSSPVIDHCLATNYISNKAHDSASFKNQINGSTRLRNQSYGQSPIRNQSCALSPISNQFPSTNPVKDPARSLNDATKEACTEGGLTNESKDGHLKSDACSLNPIRNQASKLTVEKNKICSSKRFGNAFSSAILDNLQASERDTKPCSVVASDPCLGAARDAVEGGDPRPQRVIAHSGPDISMTDRRVTAKSAINTPHRPATAKTETSLALLLEFDDSWQIPQTQDEDPKLSPEVPVTPELYPQSPVYKLRQDEPRASSRNKERHGEVVNSPSDVSIRPEKDRDVDANSESQFMSPFTLFLSDSESVSGDDADCNVLQTAQDDARTFDLGKEASSMKVRDETLTSCLFDSLEPIIDQIRSQVSPCGHRDGSASSIGTSVSMETKEQTVLQKGFGNECTVRERATLQKGAGNECTVKEEAILHNGAGNECTVKEKVTLQQGSGNDCAIKEKTILQEKAGNECTVSEQGFLQKGAGTSSRVNSHVVEEGIVAGPSFVGDVSILNRSKKRLSEHYTSMPTQEQGEFIIIDVCANLDLFHTFISEWNEQATYALSLACEPVEKPSTIGYNVFERNNDWTTTETSGLLSPLKEYKIVGLAVCWDDKDAYYINFMKEINLRPKSGNNMDISEHTPPNDSRLSLQSRLDAVRSVLHKLHSIKVAFDAKDLYKALRVCAGVSLQGPIKDPGIATWILNPCDKMQPIPGLVKQFLSEDFAALLKGLDTMATGSLGLTINSRSSGRLRSCIEAVLAHNIMRILDARITEDGMEEAFMTIEMPLIRPLAEMELSGIGFSRNECEKLKSILQKRLSSLQDQCYGLAGHPFSLTSPEEVARVLYLELKLPYEGILEKQPKKVGFRSLGRKLKHLSTAKTALDKIRSFHPMPDLIMEWRKVNNALSKFVFPLFRKRKFSAMFQMERIFSECQTYTSTGRMSFTEPNLQNVPKDFDIHLGSEVGQGPSAIAEGAKGSVECTTRTERGVLHANPSIGIGFGKGNFSTSSGNDEGITSTEMTNPNDSRSAGAGIVEDSPPTGAGDTRRSRKRIATSRKVSADSNAGESKTEHAHESFFAVSMRTAFVPFSDGILLAADYSQMELRLFAHLSQDTRLIQIFNDEGDVFKIIASEMFTKKQELVTSEQRQHAKHICYGILYGIGAKSLGQQLNMDPTHAQQYMNSFMNRFHGIRTYVKHIVTEARKNGYVTTLMKRRRYLPSINSTNMHARAQAERQAVNTTVQGSAADITKKAIIKIDLALKDVFKRCVSDDLVVCCNKDDMLKPTIPERDVNLVLQLHDELLFEVKTSKLQTVAQIVKTGMEKAVLLDVNMPVKISIGKSWGTLEPYVVD